MNGAMFTRRAALAGLTAAAATPVLAKAPMTGVRRPQAYTAKLGAFEVSTIFDGAVQFPGPHPIFGQDKTKEEVDALLVENFLPTDTIEIGFTPVIVNTGNEVVLFDTGNGALRRGKGAGLMRERLGVIGITPEQVDVIVLTHFHPDHIGGLMEDGQPAYPNARYVTMAAEYDFWSPEDKLTGGTERVAKLTQSNVVPMAEKMTFLTPDQDVVSGITAIDASGHTPGHAAIHIESEGKRLLLGADFCNHYVVSMQRPDWHVRFDMDKAKAGETRKRLFDMIAADRIPFAGYHMPFPSIGYAEKLGEGYRFVPASYQLNL
ncbi:MAG: MBL fold metallo-hydrolase [Pseudomonadota bacterium]